MDNDILEVKDAILKATKDGMTELKGQLDNLKTEQGQMQRQLDAIDAKSQRPAYAFGGGQTKDLASQVHENDGFKSFAQTGRGRVIIPVSDLQLSLKSTITSTGLGFATSGVVPMTREAGIVPIAMETFRIRQLLRNIPTTAAAIDFVRVASVTNNASPQVEASAKQESAMTFETDSEKIETLAHWIPASKQSLQDLAGLQECIDTHLIGGLLDREDTELLNGSGVSPNLHGLTIQATAFDTALLSSADGWERADQIARAIQQLETAKRRATAIVLNPADWWAIVLTKNSVGNYIHGDPANMTATRLWGRPVSVTTAMTAGKFLVGDFVTGSALYVRQDGVIEASDSHDDFWIKNLIAIRCEERVALVTYKPDAYILGTFGTSPAS